MSTEERGAGVIPPNDPIVEAMRELAAELRGLRAELRAQRDKKVSTRRVKSVRRAAQTADVPVSDIAAMAARRALARVTG